MANEACVHLEAVREVKRPAAQECEACVEKGGTWTTLRTCQTCGTTRCCDSSPDQHATAHAKEAGHPVIASAEPGERWMYCYEDEQTIAY